MENSKFEMVLQSASNLPGVKIDREKFLSAELQKYCPADVVKLAVETSPHNANIPTQLIDTIAKQCITYETNKVSAISFATGIPGGLTMLGTIPADVAQYFGHILRIVQKLAYLYDWEELFNPDKGLDDETGNLLTLFVGIMFGVNGAAGALNKIVEKAGEKTYKTLMAKALTKGGIYPVVKRVAQALGVKMTKEIFAKGVSKAVPILGGFASGGLTYVTYRPMANRLRKYLMGLNSERNTEEEEVIL